MLGIRKIVVLAHEWEPDYKDEFRRAARLARELNIAVEPYFEDDDPRFDVNSYAEKDIDTDMYDTPSPHATDDSETKDASKSHAEN